MTLSPQRQAVLDASPNEIQLSGIKRGIEKESLRINNDGSLAFSPHPLQLGSALTHPHITTDFSEALLEFITSPSIQIEDTLSQLNKIHKFTYANLENELLWVNSMPCALPHDDAIPVAQYGTSNTAQMKTNYRLGLGHRYGRLMQTIAGIHFNFSLPDEFWQFLKSQDKDTSDFKEYRTHGYLHLIRNFRRYFWLLLYLFGSSPAVCPTFVKGRQHNLTPVGKGKKSLHGPYATSLRMGDLGYQSTAQQSISINYNSLPDYLSALCKAITQPHPDYEKIGIFDDSGNYKQLNTGILQIENEFYSTIRPKRTSKRGETALSALFHRGIEYVEVRCLDLNPFHPLGIDKEQIHFLDTFLMYCAIADSPLADKDENKRVQDNQQRMVYSGRDPALTLKGRSGERHFREWAQRLLDELEPIAQMFDRNSSDDKYSSALSRQKEKVEDETLTPSAKVLDMMDTKNQTFFEFALSLAEEHKQYFCESDFSEKTNLEFERLAKQSLQDQTKIEQEDSDSFAEYLKKFYAQYEYCGTCG